MTFLCLTLVSENHLLNHLTNSHFKKWNTTIKAERLKLNILTFTNVNYNEIGSVQSLLEIILSKKYMEIPQLTVPTRKKCSVQKETLPQLQPSLLSVTSMWPSTFGHSKQSRSWRCQTQTLQCGDWCSVEQCYESQCQLATAAADKYRKTKQLSHYKLVSSITSKIELNDSVWNLLYKWLTISMEQSN